MITEDIAMTKNIKLNTIVILKKLLWLVATSTCLTPNIDKISKNLQVTRDIIYQGFEYLAQSGLTTNIYPQAQGMKLIRKPAKIYLNNTNLLKAINQSLSLDSDTGSARETFFANQIGIKHSIHTHATADFLIDNQYVIEVGGKNKKPQQIKGLDHAYLAIDGLPIGLKNRIPLYLFGFLY